MINLKGKINWKVALFWAIILLAVFLRVYNFNDWLLAKGDQVRDGIKVSRAFEGGVGDLPLLGPRAGGTKLHLGPAYYYLLYGSSIISGNVALPTTAYPNLIFSLLSIWIFYFFSKEYFSKDWTMVLTGMFSLSYLAIEHARFPWNPNSTIFFSLLFVFALLKIFKLGKEKNIWWAALAGFAYAIGSQLHFTFFVAFPVITIVFLAFNYKKITRFISWKQAGLFFLVIIFFYIPVIVSDILNNGENFRLFFSSISSKSSEHSFFKNLQKDFYYFGKYTFRIITGYFGPNKLLHYAGSLLAVLGLGALIASLRKESDVNKRNFLLLNLILFITFFLVYIPLAYSIDKPRFYLPIFFVLFIFLGLIAQIIVGKAKSHIAKFSLLFLAAVILSSNVFFVAIWFRELGNSTREAVNPKDTIILKTKKDSAWILWEQFVFSADKLKRDCPQGNIYLSFSKKVAEFEDTFDYALTYTDKNLKLHAFKISENLSFDSTACYYYIFRNGDEMPKDLNKYSNQKEDFSIGSLGILKIEIKNSDILDDLSEAVKDPATSELEEDSGQNEYWKDVFQKK